MNLCILLGEVISEVKFKFILKGKHKAIAYFNYQLLNKSEIKIKAYDEMADYVYRKLQIGMKIIIKGKLRENEVVEAEKIYLT